MDVNWGDLLAAVSILFIVEGIFPFLNPGGTRRVLAQLAEMGDRELRIAGFLSMLVGVGVLYIARS